MTALAAVITGAIAAPMLREPSERVFGLAIVGRHHDPFTVMAQFARPWSAGVYAQPVTDLTGALLARASGPIAAYNWLVLLSFPLAAAGAFLLARHLALSPVAAAFAGLAYAFAPFHLAHAAYHPHIAQTQWIPLYLLALWRCLDAPSRGAVLWLVAATGAVTLSNFYGGFIAAVITPVALLAYWLATRHAAPHAARRLGITAGALVAIAAAGIGYAWFAARQVIANPHAFAFPRNDLFLYSATWWSYLVPPVEHPLLGAAALGVWRSAGVHDGLLEQQVYVGWGLIALGLVAVAAWLRSRTATPAVPTRAIVPALAVIAAVALVCSLSPERTIGAFRFVRPSALLYDIAPMFRSYARFGIVVQLMAALVAGIGVDALRRSGTRGARLAWMLLVAVVIGEYAVAPSAMSRDVLPTPAHRWVAAQPGRVQAFDCVPLTQESASVPWLSGGRIVLGTAETDCTEPNFPEQLAAGAFTHLVIRRDSDAGRWLATHPLPSGLTLAARFREGSVFAVTAPAPRFYTEAWSGFSPRESNPAWSWRWMGSDASWTIVNAGATPAAAALDLELSAFHVTRRLELRLDGRPVQTLTIDPDRRSYVAAFALPAGRHALTFHPIEAPTVADSVIGNGDTRPLSFAIGTWRWTLPETHP